MPVSIHTPTQGVTIERQITKQDAMGFNPHTHAGCDIDRQVERVLKGVSIHTPTQGVTCCLPS